MSDRDLEDPIITKILRTGFAGQEYVEAVCPVCGAVADRFFRDHHTWEIMGCEYCVDEIDTDELEGDMDSWPN